MSKTWIKKKLQDEGKIIKKGEIVLIFYCLVVVIIFIITLTQAHTPQETITQLAPAWLGPGMPITVRATRWRVDWISTNEYVATKLMFTHIDYVPDMIGKNNLMGIVGYFEHDPNYLITIEIELGTVNFWDWPK